MNRVTHRFQNYTILYTHDTSIPQKNWQSRPATCRDSFGTIVQVRRQGTGGGQGLQDLPTDTQYTVCVVSSRNGTTRDDNCAKIELNKGVSLF